MLSALKKFFPEDVAVHGIAGYLPPDLGEFLEIEEHPISVYSEPEWTERWKWRDPPPRIIGGWKNLVQTKIRHWKQAVGARKKIPQPVDYCSCEPVDVAIGKQFVVKMKSRKAAHEVARLTLSKLQCQCKMEECDHEKCNCRCSYFLGDHWKIKIKIGAKFHGTQTNCDDNLVCFLKINTAREFYKIKRTKFSVWLFHKDEPVAQIF